MSKLKLNITDEEREEADRRAKNFIDFIHEVFEDPTILELIPSGSNVRAIPIKERDPNHHYDIVTPRMVATVSPGSDQDQPQPDSAGAQ